MVDDSKKYSNKGISQEEVKELKEIFELFSPDENGEIEIDELKKANNNTCFRVNTTLKESLIEYLNKKEKEKEKNK